MRRVLLHILETLVLTFTISSCESKFYESSPEVVKSSGYSIDERLVQKAKIDTNIDEIQNDILKLKDLFDSIIKIQSPRDEISVPTPLNFILEVNKEMKSQIPENNEGHLIRHSHFLLSNSDLTDQCRKIEIRLESLIITNQSGIENTTPGHRINYLIKTCNSLGQYLNFITVEINTYEVEIKFNNETLNFIYNTSQREVFSKTTSCKILKNNKMNIDTIRCENAIIYLNKREYIDAKSIFFYTKGEVQIEIHSDVYEEKIKKTSFNIQKLTNGKITEI